MRPVHLAETVRAAEEAFFTAHPDIDLMSRAAGEVAASAQRMLRSQGKVLVVAGSGNNGADSLFAAATLAGIGHSVSCWLTSGVGHTSALHAAQQAGCTLLSPNQARSQLPDVDLVIDGFTGIGGRPGLPADVAGFAQSCRESGIPVLSVDLPSGLDADSNLVTNAFYASQTMTFATEKRCHVARPAADYCGEVTVADIGLRLGATDLYQAEIADLVAAWPCPDAHADKYSRGVVCLDTGSAGYPGAAVLSALGAAYSGAGMVRYTGPAAGLILAATPSVVVQGGRAQSVVIGSGWGDADRKRFERSCELNIPMVVDAEALLCLPSTLPKGSLLTPHSGELARLLEVPRETVLADPVAHVRAAAAEHEVTVLLKGASQYVATPDGVVTIAVPGPAWNAQAGSGDVLAGICGTLLAAGLTPDQAALAASGLQALTSAHHPGPFPPDRLAQMMPGVLAGLLAQYP